MHNRSYAIISLLALIVIVVGCMPTKAPTPTGVPPTKAPADTAVPTEAPTKAPSPEPTEPPPPSATPVPPATAAPTPPPAASARFAPYAKEPVTIEPSVSHDPIAADLSNVISAFLLSQPQRDRLAQNGFVVSPSEEKEFYMLYEKARYNFEPIFITTDSLLHVYHLLFDKVLRSLEREQFIPTAQELNALMLQAAEAQYESLQGTSLEESARRNVAYFAVASYLLDPTVAIPTYAADLAQAEIDLIMAHSGIQPSPLFPGLPYGEDYTQYIPRGHYTRGEDLEAYFRTLMWYGRMTFRVGKTEDPSIREETQRALLIVQALATNPEATARWESIYEPTVFFVGRSDDLLYTEYIQVMEQVYGETPDLVAFADEEKLTEFMEAAKELRPPRILGMVIGPETEDVEEGTKGFRFMGQRFIPDSYVFRQLVWRNVGDCEPPNRRGMPKGLDWFAVIGSERAYALLEEQGDTEFSGYAEKMATLREEFATLEEDEWTQNLYWSWLYTFFPLLDEPGEGYPAFMQSQAWLDKSLNTVLGSWAELRHDTILYAKQSYAEMGGGGKGPPPSPVPPKGYVEPVPEFYARLAALAQMTHRGLNERGLVPELGGSGEDSELALAVAALADLGELSLELKAMAEKELTGRPLSEDEYSRIRFYGGELERFTFAAADEGGAGDGIPMSEEEPQAAVIADVHTDPDPNCDGGSDDAAVLEEAIGRIFAIYVVVPIEGELIIAKGGVFSYYEFPWPADDRLTDEKWREMLDQGEAPPLPEWTASFRVDETEEAALREAVWGFNQQWIAALWWPEPNYMERVATGEALEQSRAHAQALVDEQRYEGQYLVRMEYLSFDLQDADHAIVTTRETWWAELYEIVGEDWEPGEVTATRPEHTIGVIYHLERIDDRWLVSKTLIEGEIPAWEEVDS